MKFFGLIIDVHDGVDLKRGASFIRLTGSVIIFCSLLTVKGMLIIFSGLERYEAKVAELFLNLKY